MPRPESLRRRQRRLVRARRSLVVLVVLLAAVTGTTWAADALDITPRHGAAREPAATALATTTARPEPVGTSSSTVGSSPATASSPGTAPARATRTYPVPAPNASGKGTFHPVRGAFLRPVDRRPATGPGAPRVIRFALEVEDGLHLDEALALRVIGSTLTNPRGWEEVQRVKFVHVPAGGEPSPDVVVVIASPGTTDVLCAPLQTEGEYSCQPSGSSRVVLNARRWAGGVPGYSGDLADYRAMLVNHEVGHYLGHGHVHCPGKGAPAPVMQQQSISLEGCRPNPWPKVA